MGQIGVGGRQGIAFQAEGGLTEVQCGSQVKCRRSGAEQRLERGVGYISRALSTLPEHLDFSLRAGRAPSDFRQSNDTVAFVL